MGQTKMKPTNVFIGAWILNLLLALSWAQTGVGVSPPGQILTAQPGQEVRGVVLVDHPSDDAPMIVDVSLGDVAVQPDGNLVFLAPGTLPRSAAQWITVQPLSFNLSPKEAREVHYSVRVPQDVQPGTYWAMLFFNSGPTGKTEETQGVGVRVHIRVGHIIYVNIGEITYSGRVEGMRYLPPSPKNPPEVRVKFHNTGNGLLRLNGYVELRDAKGQTVARGEIKNAASLPGFSYELAAELASPPPSGDYVALVMLDYGGEKVIVGEGTVHVP